MTVQQGMPPALVSVALDYHRAPLRYSHLSDPAQALPASFDTQLLEFGSALAAQNIEATARRMGSSGDELRTASLFFLRHTLLAPGSDCYRILGVSRKASQDTIRHHYLLLVRLFHPDRAPDHIELYSGYTARINQAFRTLSEPGTRRNYERSLKNPDDGRHAQRPQPGYARTQQLNTLAAAPRATKRHLSVMMAMLVVIASAMFLWWLTEWPGDPGLIADPSLLERGTNGPTYLQGTSSTHDNTVAKKPLLQGLDDSHSR